MRAVKSICEHRINEDEHNENDNASLLRKPKAQLEAANLNLVKHVNEKNPAPERNDEPDAEENADQAQIGNPILAMFHAVLHRLDGLTSLASSDCIDDSFCEEEDEDRAVEG